MQRFLFIGLLIVFSGSPSVESANWPIKDFKVIHMVPGNTDMPDAQADLEEFNSWNPDDQAGARLGLQGWSRLSERYLNDIARRFEAQGFAPPRMPVIVDKDDGGKRKYAVYFLDFREKPDLTERIQNALHGHDPDAALAEMVNVGCERDRIPWLGINRKKFAPDQEQLSGESDNAESIEARAWDTPARDLWKTLAHEVFHAIQGAYASRHGSLRMCLEGGGQNFGDIKSIKVIAEGTADAAAYFLAEKKWPDWYSYRNTAKVLGGNGYIASFFGSPWPYHTNSFWRFIAEEQNGLQYLEHLFRQPLKPNPSGADRIRWVDEAFQMKGDDPSPVQESLYTLFPRAVTEIFSYATRYGTEEETWIEWMTYENGCMSKTAVDSGTANIPLKDLRPISAQCADIDWPRFSQPVEMKIEAIASSQAEADQLHLGISRLVQDSEVQYCWEWSGSGGGRAGKDTCLEEKVKVQTGPKEGRFAKIWIMDSEMFKNAGSARLVISNVAPPRTSRFPGAPGPEGTKRAKGVELRYGFARVEADEEYPPPTQITPMGPTTLMGVLPPFRIRRAEPILLASTAPVSPEMLTSVWDTHKLKEMMYGIRPGASLNIDEMPDLSSFRIGEAGGKSYIMTPFEDVGLGFTGPLKADISREVPNQATFVSSSLCMAGTADSVETMPPVGSIDKSDELELRIRISTNLCEVDPMSRPQPPLPVVDNLTATLILPLGWRYYAPTAPQDILTPGVQVYMDRYFERMRGVPQLENILKTYLGEGDGTDDSGSAGGASTTVGGCDCSCGALKRVREQGRNAADTTMEEKMSLANCAMQCVQQWQACPDQDPIATPQPPQVTVLTETPKDYSALAGDVESVLDVLVGKDAPENIRTATRPHVEAMSIEERTQILQSQQGAGGDVLAVSRDRGPYSETGVVRIPVNPKWDSETLLYKDAVEQLGMTADITEDAVEMFFNNEAPMRERLWKNVREQLAKKAQ